MINAPKRKLTVELAAPAAAEQAEPAFRFTDAQLDTYGVYEVQVLEQVLRDSQPEAMANVAATIRHKIGATLMGDDREFLVAYYQAARARMERGLLFGKRRENKFDRGEATAKAGAAKRAAAGCPRASNRPGRRGSTRKPPSGARTRMPLALTNGPPTPRSRKVRAAKGSRQA